MTDCREETAFTAYTRQNDVHSLSPWPPVSSVRRALLNYEPFPRIVAFRRTVYKEHITLHHISLLAKLLITQNASLLCHFSCLSLPAVLLLNFSSILFHSFANRINSQSFSNSCLGKSMSVILQEKK